MLLHLCFNIRQATADVWVGGVAIPELLMAPALLTITTNNSACVVELVHACMGGLKESLPCT